jgi:DNA-binding transcriptional LysR family regulator
MDLNEISIYIKVIQTGSFSQAAKILDMPKSTVSSKISSLEKRLSTTLIQRTTRKLNITPAGEAYFKRCLSGLEEIKSAESELTALQGEPSGLLRVTAPYGLGGTVLPDLFSDFSKKYPKVTLEVMLTERRVDLLSENVDLAIRGGVLKDSTLIAKKIGAVYFAPFASPKYVRNANEIVHPRDLMKHRCLNFSPIGMAEWKLVGPKGSLDIPINAAVSVNDMSILKMMCLRGEGVSYLPTYACIDEVNAGKLVRLLPEWRSTLNPIHFVYPAQKFVTPKLSAFIAMAIEPLRQSFREFEI